MTKTSNNQLRTEEQLASPAQPLASLAGKTALVTGGGRGIGKAMAERLASLGAIVFINYAQDHNAAQSVVDAIAAKGGRAIALKADVGDTQAVQAMFAAIDRELTANGASGLDILINNAGVGAFGDVEATDEATFDQVFDTHVKGAFFVTREAVTRLRNGGRIITMSSGLARRPQPGVIAYAMAKAALETFTVALAQQLGERAITANAIAPGWTETDINRAYLRDAANAQAVINETALGRIGQVDDIAAVAAFLVSAEAGWVTGQIIEASGGFGLVRRSG